jgi:hypothetical protein
VRCGWEHFGGWQKHFMYDSLPRAEGEKGLPPRAELDVKSGGRREARLPLGFGLGSPLMAMMTAPSSLPPGGSPTSSLARR